jgi:precorrin-3B C17-methyltransferase
MSGCLAIVGLGPGDEARVTPEVTAALDQATDVVGYGPYLARVADRAGLTRHATDNREELARSRDALRLAADGRRVVIVSSGDPGVFAMAAAVFEAIEAGPEDWRRLDIRVLPGITAMLAAAAHVGAPLGHDFCAINLSDNLKPWALIERRIRLALEADFVIALYNPRSKARPEGMARTLDLLRATCAADRILVFARAVSTGEETVHVVPLAQAMPEMADMRTLVIIGSSATRVVTRPNAARPWVYTPRAYDSHVSPASPPRVDLPRSAP